MPPQKIQTDPGPDDSVSEPNGPGKGPMGPGWIVAVAIYLVLVSISVLYGLVKLWPYPTPSGESKAQVVASPSQPDKNAAAASTQTTPAASTPQPAASAATGAGGTAVTTGATPNANASPGRQATSSAGPASGTATQTTTPPVPQSTTATVRKELPDPEVISFFGDTFKPTIYLETRLLLLVMLSGALGSLMHSLRSLYWYTGNRMMVWSWVGFYVLLPFTGAILAVIFYFVVRGGFFSPQASFENTSPFGFAALSTLVGLFSPQATLKLKEIAETIFTKPPAGEDTKSQESGSEANADESEANTETTASTSSASEGDAAADDLDVHDLDLKPDTPDEDLPITEGGVG